MKTNLLHPFEPLPYFTIEGFRQASGMDSPEQARLLLHRWARAGHILPLKKGVYMTRRFYELHRADAPFTPALSAMGRKDSATVARAVRAQVKSSQGSRVVSGSPS